jgi:hypothetical protein
MLCVKNVLWRAAVINLPVTFSITWRVEIPTFFTAGNVVMRGSIRINCTGAQNSIITIITKTTTPTKQKGKFWANISRVWMRIARTVIFRECFQNGLLSAKTLVIKARTIASRITHAMRMSDRLQIKQHTWEIRAVNSMCYESTLLAWGVQFIYPSAAYVTSASHGLHICGLLLISRWVCYVGFLVLRFRLHSFSDEQRRETRPVSFNKPTGAPRLSIRTV